MFVGLLAGLHAAWFGYTGPSISVFFQSTNPQNGPDYFIENDTTYIRKIYQWTSGLYPTRVYDRTVPAKVKVKGRIGVGTKGQGKAAVAGVGSVSPGTHSMQYESTSSDVGPKIEDRDLAGTTRAQKSRSFDALPYDYFYTYPKTTVTAEDPITLSATVTGAGAGVEFIGGEGFGISVEYDDAGFSFSKSFEDATQALCRTVHNQGRIPFK